MRRLAAAILLVASLALSASCSGDDEAARTTPAPNVFIPPPSVTGVMITGPSPTPISTATPAIPPTPLLLPGVPMLPPFVTRTQLTQPAAKREMGPIPASPFPAPKTFDNVMIYDTTRMDYLDLGRGRRPMFSPDSRLAAWVEGDVSRDQPGEAWVIDLQTRERWQIGQASFISFIDERHVEGLVASMPADGTRAMVDVYTGAVSQAPPYVSSADGITTIRGNYKLRQGLQLGAVPSRSAVHTVYDSDNRALFQFQASGAAFSGPDELIVASMRQDGLASLYTVLLTNRTTAYVATIRDSEPYFPVAANAGYVVWTDHLCDFPAGGSPSLRILNRKTGAVVEAAAFVFPVLSTNRLLNGYSQLDPETLQYTVVLPGFTPAYPQPADARIGWSPDFRYLATGAVGGGGEGMCFPNNPFVRPTPTR